MVEPSGHCPYLGLKQNQAIRFASPTPEHRCYAAGQAQEILKLNLTIKFAIACRRPMYAAHYTWGCHYLQRQPRWRRLRRLGQRRLR